MVLLEVILLGGIIFNFLISIYRIGVQSSHLALFCFQDVVDCR